jgi:hypothetical protein
MQTGSTIEAYVEFDDATTGNVKEGQRLSVKPRQNAFYRTILA